MSHSRPSSVSAALPPLPLAPSLHTEPIPRIHSLVSSHPYPLSHFYKQDPISSRGPSLCGPLTGRAKISGRHHWDPESTSICTLSQSGLATAIASEDYPTFESFVSPRKALQGARPIVNTRTTAGAQHGNVRLSRLPGSFSKQNVPWSFRKPSLVISTTHSLDSESFLCPPLSVSSTRCSAGHTDMPLQLKEPGNAGPQSSLLPQHNDSPYDHMLHRYYPGEAPRDRTPPGPNSNTQLRSPQQNQHTHPSHHTPSHLRISSGLSRSRSSENIDGDCPGLELEEYTGLEVPLNSTAEARPASPCRIAAEDLGPAVNARRGICTETSSLRPDKKAIPFGPRLHHSSHKQIFPPDLHRLEDDSLLNANVFRSHHPIVDGARSRDKPLPPAKHFNPSSSPLPPHPPPKDVSLKRGVRSSLSNRRRCSGSLHRGSHSWTPSLPRETKPISKHGPFAGRMVRDKTKTRSGVMKLAPWGGNAEPPVPPYSDIHYLEKPVSKQRYSLVQEHPQSMPNVSSSSSSNWSFLDDQVLDKSRFETFPPVLDRSSSSAETNEPSTPPSAFGSRSPSEIIDVPAERAPFKRKSALSVRTSASNASENHRGKKTARFTDDSPVIIEIGSHLHYLEYDDDDEIRETGFSFHEFCGRRSSRESRWRRRLDREAMAVTRPSAMVSFGSAEHSPQAVGCGIVAEVAPLSAKCFAGSDTPTKRVLPSGPAVPDDLGIGISLSSNASASSSDSVSTPDNTLAHLGPTGHQHVYSTCATLSSCPLRTTRGRLEELRLSSQIQGGMMIGRLKNGNDRHYRSFSSHPPVGYSARFDPRGNNPNSSPNGIVIHSMNEFSDTFLPVWERVNCGLGESTKQRLRESASRVGSSREKRHLVWVTVPLHSDIQLAVQVLRSS